MTRVVLFCCRVSTGVVRCLWLQRCELVRATPRNPLLVPLRWPLPLKDFANIWVAVSGYSQGVCGVMGVCWETEVACAAAAEPRQWLSWPASGLSATVLESTCHYNNQHVDVWMGRHVLQATQ